MSYPARSVVDWPARVSAYRARIRKLMAERDEARTMLRTTSAQASELRRELSDVGLVLRAFAEALPTHGPECLCQTCQVRRQALAAADSYVEA